MNRLWLIHRHCCWTALILVFLAAALPGTGVFGETICVPADQPSIQAGIDAAMDGDIVLVAPGTYQERIDFHSRAAIVVSEAGSSQTTISAPSPGSVVVFTSGEGPGSVLEGFTLRDGSGTVADAGRVGGGIYCLDSSPTIRRNVLTFNSANRGGGLYCRDSSPAILGNMITGNHAPQGGGVNCRGGAPAISNNIIQHNTATVGGGFFCAETMALISGNIVRDNTADGDNDTMGIGGGGYIGDSGTVENPIQLVNNLIEGNLAYAWNLDPILNSAFGGGLTIIDAAVHIDHCTFSSNWADTMYHGPTYGGALCLGCGSAVTVSSSILYFDAAVELGGFEVAIYCPATPWSTITLHHSDVQYGSGGFYISDPGNTWEWGEAMLSENPLFVAAQPYYLAQVPAGQPWNSPCVDAGDPVGSLVLGTTRTDGRPDHGVTDMGYHYLTAPAVVIAGPGPSPENPPLVRVFSAGSGAEVWYEFDAYGTPRYGVNVASGNLDDPTGLSVLTGAGPGDVFGPHVRGFRMDGTPLPGLSFFAYGTHKYGVNVAAGDLDADGIDEIITGAGPGTVFGSHVRGWIYSGASGVTPFPGVSYFAYGSPKWGVNVAAGDIDGDGFDEIVTGAGPGAVYGPHIRGWNVDGGVVAAISEVNYLAYGTHRYGVRVCCGDLDGDGLDEIISAPGPSAQFGAHIRGWAWDGATMTAIPGISFFAWPPGQVGYGAQVASGADLDSDGRDEILVAPGPDPAAGSPVHVYGFPDGQIELQDSFTAFEGLTHGSTLAAGRI